MTDSYLQPQEEQPFLLQIINHLARQQTALGSMIGNAAGVPSDAKREGWDDVTSEPEDFPLGPACDLSGEGGCESCQ